MSDPAPKPPTMSAANPQPDGAATASIGLQRLAALHIFTRDLRRARDHFVDTLDFAETAASTPALEEEHGVRAAALEAGAVRLVLLQPIAPAGELHRWLDHHPDGVGRVVFEVADVDRAFAALIARGATPVGDIEARAIGGATARWFDITTPIGDTLFRFVAGPELPSATAALAPLAEPRGPRNRFRFGQVDHITLNFLTLKPALLWMEHVLGLEPYWDIRFHTGGDGEAAAEAERGSGLRSVVMWDPVSGVKIANNEPARPRFRDSQIYLFCEDNHGAGVQHVALTVPDIVATVANMRCAGVKFVPSPSRYYDLLPQHLVRLGVDHIDEELGALRELGILVDGRSPREYLLQVFMREAAALFGDRQAGPLFFEIIQRKGDRGFGAGNFRALFESIEQQHESDGRVAPAGGQSRS